VAHVGFTNQNHLMRFEGVLKSWTDDRGFGFIELDQDGAEVFIHIKTIANL
jgi:cold shock CspA family protein